MSEIEFDPELTMAKRTSRYRALARLAKQLGLKVASDDKFPRLKANVEAKFAELFRQSGIEPGSTILYSDGSPSHAGKKAKVVSLEIKWIQDLPNVTLTMEGKTKKHLYHAHGVALYATAVK